MVDERWLSSTSVIRHGACSRFLDDIVVIGWNTSDVVDGEHARMAESTVPYDKRDMNQSFRVEQRAMLSILHRTAALLFIQSECS